MAEAFFRSAVEKEGLGFTVSSAGTLEGDRLIPSAVVTEIQQADPQMAARRSRALRKQDILAADLVVGMTRGHVREVVVLAPDAWHRTFTLKELVRRGGLIGPRRPGQALADWIAEVSVGRSRSELLGDSILDDIEDPVGGSTSVVREVAREIRSAVGGMVELVAPTPGPSPVPTGESAP
jgi:protein-tyrosine-phosphatase